MRNSFESGKVEYIGYGVSVKNHDRDGDIRKTVAFQELSALNLPEELMSIDMVWSNSSNLPKLHSLIETIGKDQGIILYSIDTLLIGSSNEGIEYYEWMLRDELNLRVYDMTGRWPRLSEFSIENYTFNHDIESAQLKERLLEKLTSYYEKTKHNFKVRRINQKATPDFYLTDSPFKEIYYAYESYQIDLPTTMELLKEYCGINNVLTLRRLVQEYEKTILFSKEFLIYALDNRFILDLPKRCGTIPNEFFELKNMVDTYKSKNADLIQDMNEEDIFKNACSSTNILTNYQIYHRWDLAYMKKPKPRKPILRNFDIKEFKNKFKPINQ